MPPGSAFFCWDEVSQTFLLELAWNHILLILVSKVVRITGMSHRHLVWT
jgi:hypothetical protein